MIALLLAPLLLAPPYDPLAVSTDFDPVVRDQSLADPAHARTLPIRIFHPMKVAGAPVVLFSHGLGGSSKNNGYIGRHLARRGYVAIFLQHPGSDESVWRGVPMRERMGAMKRAASGLNFTNRIQDVRFVLDQLPKLFSQPGKIGMSGHSFGAVTTQAVSGQSFPGLGQRFTDPRIAAAVMYSPSPDRAGRGGGFESVKIPWLLMTGTLDDSPIGDLKPADRLKVFPSLPEGDKYELVLWEGAHGAFSDGRLPTDRGKRNPNHHRAILALSTAFWDAYLLGDTRAKSWLQKSARSVLEPKDIWKQK